MSSTPFKMKGITPLKHIRSRGNHNEKYHKTDKTNKAHPNYWKGGLRSGKSKDIMRDIMKKTSAIGGGPKLK